jgi:hypothetical protein
MADWNPGPITNGCAVLGECTLTAVTTPFFVDSASCQCNFQENRATYGNGKSLWRCIGNASADVSAGSSGKWYYPILLAGNKNNDFSGDFLPVNSADYPVDTSETYIVVDNGDGVYVYAQLTSQNQNELSAIDSVCTGMNDTEASTRYYATLDDSSDPSDSSDSSGSSDPSDFSDSSASESSSLYIPSSTDQFLSMWSSSSAFRSVLSVQTSKPTSLSDTTLSTTIGLAVTTPPPSAPSSGVKSALSAASTSASTLTSTSTISSAPNTRPVTHWSLVLSVVLSTIVSFLIL